MSRHIDNVAGSISDNGNVAGVFRTVPSVPSDETAIFPPVPPYNGLPFVNSTPPKSSCHANNVIVETPTTQLVKVAFPDDKEKRPTITRYQSIVSCRSMR
jgi:hypothetical protein